MLGECRERASEATIERDTLRFRAADLEGRVQLAEDARDSSQSLAQRLLNEIEEAKVNITAEKQKVASAELRTNEVVIEHEMLKNAVAAAKKETKRLEAQNTSLAQQVQLLEEKVRVWKDVKAIRSKQEHRLMETITNLHSCVTEAAAHAKSCSANTYFASKSTKLHTHLKQVFQDLVALATEKTDTTKEPQDRRKSELKTMLEDL